MKLIIAEKPSVAKSIAAALGIKPVGNGYFQNDEYLVSWCIGHLVCRALCALMDCGVVTAVRPLVELRRFQKVAV